MRIATRSVGVAAALAAGAMLASACAPTTPAVEGIGQGTPTPSVTVQANPQPTPTEWTVDDTAPGIPDDLGDDVVDVPVGAPDIPVYVEPGNMAELTFPSAGKFTSSQTESAFEFAASFAAFRYSSGLWADEDMRAKTPVAYYVYSEYMSKAALQKFHAMAVDEASMAANRVALDNLAPPPPAIADGRWMSPAVANWTYGQPTFTEDEDGLLVAFEVAGVAIWQSKNGVYWGAVVRDRAGFTLVDEKGWRVDAWTSDRTIEEPFELDEAPIARYFPERVITDVTELQ